MVIKKKPDKKNVCGRLIFGVALFCLIQISASPSMAHKVYIYAWVEGDMVFTESYFGSKKKVNGGLITVFGHSGEQLVEGHTNEKGEFAFRSPKKTDLRIVVEAGMGHRNEFILEAHDFSETVVDTEGTVNTVNKKNHNVSSSLPAEAEQIRVIVEKALDSRLKPIIRELARSKKEKGPGLTEIVGGIGYIFGLMGILMFCRTKKKK